MKQSRFWPIGAALCIMARVAFPDIAKQPPGAVKIPVAPMFTNSILPGTNERPRLEAKKLDDFSSLAPGVYLTKPYTCMVRVPGATHDDIAVRRVTVPTNSMPILLPDLKVVPLGRSGN